MLQTVKAIKVTAVFIFKVRIRNYTDIDRISAWANMLFHFRSEIIQVIFHPITAPCLLIMKGTKMT